MASYSDDFNAYADGPLANNAAWENTVGGGLEVFSNQVAEDPGSGFQASSVTAATANFGADGEAQVDVVTFGSFDFCGVGYRTSTNNGYYIFAGDGEYSLVSVTGASTQTEIGSYNTVTPASGHKIKIVCSGTTISAELDTGSGFSQIISVTNSDHSTGQPGLYYDRQSSNASRMDNFSAVDSAGAGPTLDDVNTTEIVEDGETGVSLTYSNFTNPIDGVVFKSGSNESAWSNISAGVSSATADAFDVTTIASATAGCPYTSASHSIDVEVENSTDAETASLAITRNPKSGYAVVEVASATNAQGTVYEDLGAAHADTSQVLYPTAFSTSVSSTGILTTSATSNFNIWRWNVTNGEWDIGTIQITSGGGVGVISESNAISIAIGIGI